MGRKAKVLPAPRWKAIAWLSAPGQSIGPDVATALRMSMFRRLEAVVFSAIMTPAIALVSLSRHPDPVFKIWLALDLVILICRISLVVHIVRRLKYNKTGRILGPWATDFYIIAGTLWSAIFGFGSFITMATGDVPLMMTVAFSGSAILGALGVRNPASPRQNTIQMCLIALPFSIGCVFSAIPLISWFILTGPLYIMTLVSMTRQIHDDYVAMIVAQMENRRRALHCTLTGLPNRAFFDENLRDAIDDAVDLKRGLSVLSIDLDGFKQVNDHFGHPMGDALLVQVAERLTHLAAETDLVARLGGDEFVILMRSEDRSVAEALAASVNRAIAQPFHLGPQTDVTIGASIGVIVLDGESGTDLHDAGLIMTRADQALYKAKHAGKGTFRRSDDRMMEPLRLAS